MSQPRDALATVRQDDLQGASPQERERIRRIEARQDFPGAVIAGYNDDVPPDYTPIPDPLEPAPDYPPTLPYGEDDE